MSGEDPGIVTASEIASWAWCPESWRLKALGHEPGNRAELRRGDEFHTGLASFEERSGTAMSLGLYLLLLGVALAAATLLLAGGR